MSTRKHWYRPRNIILAVLLLIVALLGIETYRAITAKPGNPIDYTAKLNELVLSWQPAEAPNGWDAWMIALQTMDAQIAQNRQKYLNVPPTDPAYSWPYDFNALTDPQAPEDVRRQTQEIVDNAVAAGLHEQLARAAAYDAAYRVFPPTERMLEILLPELGQFRNVARYQAARMRLAAAAGDWTEFTAAFDQMARSAHVASHQGTLIDHLVGYAIQQLALGELNQALSQYELDAETLQRLAESLDRSPPGPLELALRAEHNFALNTIQWTHTDNGRGNGRLILSELHTFSSLASGTGPSLPNNRLINVLALVAPSKKQTTARANELYENMIEWAGMTVSQRKASGFNPTMYVEKLPRGYLLLRIILPALDNAVRSHDRALGEYVQARFRLAIERFHAERGEYPASLDALVPTYMTELPVDPTTGAPFGYEVSADPTRLAPYSLWPSESETAAPAP